VPCPIRPTYLTVKDVAVRLNVSERWVYATLKKLIPHLEFGGMIRFHVADLQEFEQSARVNLKSPRLSSRKPARQEVLKHFNFPRQLTDLARASTRLSQSIKDALQGTRCRSPQRLVDGLVHVLAPRLGGGQGHLLQGGTIDEAFLDRPQKTRFAKRAALQRLLADFQVGCKLNQRVT